MSEFGNRLKGLRIEKGYSLDMVVYDLKCKGFTINKSSLSRYENGKMSPTVDIAVELCKYYDVSLDYLIGLTDTRTPARLLAYARGMSEVKKNEAK